MVNDGPTAKVFVENLNETIEDYNPIKECDEVKCRRCGNTIPRQALEGLEPSYEMIG